MEHSIDREKIISAIEKAKKQSEENAQDVIIVPFKEVDMIISLLKEQEPAMPTWRQGKAYCGKCGQRLPRKRADRKINYCGYCGQAVKWDA